MFRVIADLAEFVRLRRGLERDLRDNIAAARASGWGAAETERVKVDVRTALSLAAKLSMWLIAPMFLLVVIVVMYLALHDPREPYGLGYSVAGMFVAVVIAAVMWLYWPLVGVLRTIHSLPRDLYRELVQPLRIRLELLNLATNATIFLYMLAPIHLGKAMPLFALGAGIWLLTPLVLFLAERDAIFLYVRIMQFGILFIVAGFVAISPVPISHFQWRAERDMANALRVVDRKEITDQWSNLEWFTPEGASLVWYSYRDDTGYHLYATPGRDPLTNAELKEVSNNEMRQRILHDFEQRRDLKERLENERKETETREAQRRQEQEAKLAQAAQEEAFRREAARIAEENAREAKAKEDARQALIAKFVYPRYADGSAKSGTVLIATGDHGDEDRSASARYSEMFGRVGCSTITGAFTSEFIASETFSALVSGSPRNSSFAVEHYAARILIVRQQTVTRQEVTNGESLVSATTTLKFQLVLADSGRVVFEDQSIGRGVAYKESTARADAIERAQAGITSIASKIAAMK